MTDLTPEEYAALSAPRAKGEDFERDQYVVMAVAMLVYIGLLVSMLRQAIGIF